MSKETYCRDCVFHRYRAASREVLCFNPNSTWYNHIFIESSKGCSSYEERKELTPRLSRLQTIILSVKNKLQKKEPQK